MVADGGVARGHALERAAPQMPGEDDVDDVLGGPARRRDRVRDRHRALEDEVLGEPHLLLELVTERIDERLSRVDAAARQQPVLAPRLLLADEEDPGLPPQDHGHADAGFHHTAREEPNPRTPRSLAGRSSTSRSVSS